MPAAAAAAAPAAAATKVPAAAKAQQSFRTTDDLFNSLSVRSIRGILQKTRQQALSKRDELRGLIGQRYRDFLSAASSADAMDKAAQGVQDDWAGIREAHAAVLATAKERATFPLLMPAACVEGKNVERTTIGESSSSIGDHANGNSHGANDGSNSAASRSEAYEQGLHAAMRVVRASQSLWGLIDDGHLDEACVRYLRCEQDLALVTTQVPQAAVLCARHWSSLQHIPQQIAVAAARTLRQSPARTFRHRQKRLRRGHSDHEHRAHRPASVASDGEAAVCSTANVAGALAALAVLRQLQPKNLLAKFLRARAVVADKKLLTNNASRSEGMDAAPDRSQLIEQFMCDVQTLLDTGAQAGALFFAGDPADCGKATGQSSGLLAETLLRILATVAPAGSSDDPATGDDVSSALQTLVARACRLRGTNASQVSASGALGQDSSQLFQILARWVADQVSTLRAALSSILDPISSVTALTETMDHVWATSVGNSGASSASARVRRQTTDSSAHLRSPARSLGCKLIVWMPSFPHFVRVLDARIARAQDATCQALATYMDSVCAAVVHAAAAAEGEQQTAVGLKRDGVEPHPEEEADAADTARTSLVDNTRACSAAVRSISGELVRICHLCDSFLALDMFASTGSGPSKAARDDDDAQVNNQIWSRLETWRGTTNDASGETLGAAPARTLAEFRTSVRGKVLSMLLFVTGCVEELAGAGALAGGRRSDGGPLDAETAASKSQSVPPTSSVAADSVCLAVQNAAHSKLLLHCMAAVGRASAEPPKDTAGNLAAESCPPMHLRVNYLAAVAHIASQLAEVDLMAVAASALADREHDDAGRRSLTAGSLEIAVAADDVSNKRLGLASVACGETLDAVVAEHSSSTARRLRLVSRGCLEHWAAVVSRRALQSFRISVCGRHYARQRVSDAACWVSAKQLLAAPSPKASVPLAARQKQWLTRLRALQPSVPLLNIAISVCAACVQAQQGLALPSRTDASTEKAGGDVDLDGRELLRLVFTRQVCGGMLEQLQQSLEADGQGLLAALRDWSDEALGQLEVDVAFLRLLHGRVSLQPEAERPAKADVGSEDPDPTALSASSDFSRCAAEIEACVVGRMWGSQSAQSAQSLCWPAAVRSAVAAYERVSMLLGIVSPAAVLAVTQSQHPNGESGSDGSQSAFVEGDVQTKQQQQQQAEQEEEEEEKKAHQEDDETDSHNLPVGALMARVVPRFQLLPGARKRLLHTAAVWQRPRAFTTPFGEASVVTLDQGHHAEGKTGSKGSSKGSRSSRSRTEPRQTGVSSTSGQQLLDDLRYDSLLQNSNYSYRPSEVASDTDDDDAEGLSISAGAGRETNHDRRRASANVVRTKVLDIGRSFFSNVGDRIKSFGGSSNGGNRGREARPR